MGKAEMVDLDTKMKIDALLDYAYNNTIERINAIEDAPHNLVYRTLAMQNNRTSFVSAYVNYYCGCFEGILFTRFLEEFDRMPAPSENAFIMESTTTKFEELTKTATDLGVKKFDKFEKTGQL